MIGKLHILWVLYLKNFLAIVEPCMGTAELEAFSGLGMANEKVESRSVQDWQVKSVVLPGKIWAMYVMG